MNDLEYSYLKEKVLKFTGLDLNGYKNQQMRRRLEGFVARSPASDAVGYCRLLEKEQARRRELIDFLAINVSEFFRDGPLFQYLKTSVLPELLRGGNRLNIWSAACSCGQEAYSLAILLDEMCCAPGRFRILATDIDESAMEQARKGGPYPAGEVRNVAPELLQSHFTQTQNGYRLNDKLKSNVVFRRHNLLLDRFERGFDLIVCRNAIIYFADTVRDALYRKFFDSLKTGGVLFIGGSEVILRPGDIGFGILRPSFYRKLPARAAADRLVKA